MLSQAPNLTNNSAQVIRQHMDESNHEMVQKLAQTMNIVFNPLIQNTMQANQHMAAQMTRLTQFFGVPQPPPQPRRELVRENQGLVIGDNPILNPI